MRGGAEVVAVTVRVTDNGASKMLAELRALGGKTVRVGILDEAPKRASPGKGKGKKASRATLLEVAAVHEFGAPAAGIPSRSFIRATVDMKRAEIDATKEKLAAQVAEGKITAQVALERLGAFVQGLVQARIAEGIGPALKPETVARKKSSKPLISTGQLRSSVTWKVGQ